MLRVMEAVNTIKKILVIRMSAIGDIILALPVLDALLQSFPQADIDFLVKAEFSGLIGNHPAVRSVLAFDKKTGVRGLRELEQEIRRQKYDLIVDLHRNPRSTYIRLRGGARMTRAYRKLVTRRLLLKQLRINLMKNAPPVADRYFTALEDFGITRDGKMPVLYIGDEEKARAGEVLADSGIGEDDDFIALAPGASYPTKRWSPAGFAEAAQNISGPDAGVVLLGDSRDQGIAGGVSRGIKERGGRVVDLTGRLSIMESAAVIARARLLITNDTGLMHVADALARPVVAVFGPTSRELGFFPLGERARVAEKISLDCRPCTLHGDAECPQGHHRCMIEISADEVVALAKDIMR